MTTQSTWLHEALNIPAEAPPAGTHPNFVHPSNLKAETRVIVAICMTASVMVAGMRMWTHIRLLHKVFLDDWICYLALMMFFVYCGIMIVITKYSIGVHQWNLTLKDVSGVLYWSRYDVVIYGFVIFLIKLTILLQCLRVFVPMKLRNATFWICHALIWFNFFFYFSFVFVAIFACKPIHRFWNPWIKGRCFNLSTFTTVTAAVNIASHLSILVLLQYVIWNLQMSSLKQKLGVSTLFLVGILACTTSSIRLYYSAKLADGKDVTYHLGIMGLWTLPEMTSGFLAMCLPVSPKFFQALKASKLGTSLRSLLFFLDFRRKSDQPNNDLLSLSVQPGERKKLAESPSPSAAQARSRRNHHRVRWDEIPTFNSDGSEEDMLSNEHAMSELSTD